MATIRILPSGNYQVMIRRKGLRTLSKTFKALGDAQIWAGQMESTTVLPAANTIAYFGQLYLNTLKGRGGTESTTYRLKNLVNGLPSVLSELTTVDIANYKSKRLSQVKGSTVRLELQLLSRIFKYAQLPDLLQGFKLPPAGKPRELTLTVTQYKMLLEDIAPKVRPLVILSWETAMRRSEILSITTNCVDWQRKILRLTDTKNGHDRDVPLNSRALAVLKTHAQLTSGGVIFTSKAYTVSQAFRRSCDRLNLPRELCFHSLRHTAITRYAQMGLNTIQLQTISGHRDITMLSRYCHIKAADIVGLIE